jgi:two-component system sensor histidine kinase HydH
MSDLKKLEKEVQRHDRLVALGKMAAGVAHEVRNPLSSIKGFATLLGKKFQPGSDEKEAADLLVHEAERLNRSITELLNYARPTPLKRALVDLNEILRNSVRLASADAEAVDANILLELDEQMDRVFVDPDRLNQVLLNLYLNGLQAMEGITSSRKLTVASGRSPDNKSVVITVTDTGCGIAEEMLDRVLDPYFTTKPAGTGLGLAMAYKIIDEHGGSIRFDSRVGEGTRVTVTLPVV